MVKTRIIAAAVLALLVPSLALAGVKEELQGVKKEIKEKNLLLNKTRRVESQVSGEIQQIDRSLKEKQANLASLGRDLARVEQGLGKTQGEIQRVTDEACKKKAQIEARVVAAYKGGDVGNLRVFFSSESLPQMTENLRYLKSVVENDKKLFAQYRDDLDRLKGLKVSLERDAATKEGIRRNIEAKKQEIEQEKQKKATYLVKVRQDKAGYLASIKELQANAARLQTMFERLEARKRKAYTAKSRTAARKPQRGSDSRTSAKAPALPTTVPSEGLGAQRGRLSLPVKGRLVEQFGKHKHPEFESFTFSNGISIAASPGTPIHAVYDGEVIFASYFKGYGNMVIVDHGGGFFSLYAHASSISKRVGAKVAKNEVLASVGDVDSTKGPLLYFEIRYQGKPVDPSPWFR